MTIVTKLNITSYTDVNNAGLKYHIHTSAALLNTDRSYDCSAASTGGHFNPLNLNPEVGDLSSMLGTIKVNNGVYTYSSSMLPATTNFLGSNSFLGLSIVFHLPDGTRWACGNIPATVDSVVKVNSASSHAVNLYVYIAAIIAVACCFMALNL
jgi:hypothetical protein